MNGNSYSPVRSSDRIEILDVYRGFAIFGIFVVNIEIMNCVFFNQGEFNAQWSGTLNDLADRIRQLFFYTKFFPIFSFLFGLGIAMQALKRIQNGAGSGGFFIRRMFFLFLIGAGHILFLWSGDVVHLYAVLGLFTVLLLRVRSSLLLFAAVILLIFPFYDQLFGWIYGWLGFKPETALSGYTSEEITQTLRNGGYWEGVVFRAREYASNIPMLINYLAPLAFSMFLLGLYIGKKRIYSDIPAFVSRITKPVMVVILLATVYRLFFLFIALDAGWHRDESLGPWLGKLMVICDVLTGLFYLWLIGWLWRFDWWKKVLRPFTYVGRMALSNYLLQSIFGLLLFSSLGLGLYETMSPWETLLAAVLFFVFQIFLSRLWLRVFKFGLFEWLWRCLSYGQFFPLRRGRR